MKSYKNPSVITSLLIVSAVFLLAFCSTSKKKKGYEYFPDMAYTGPHKDASVYEAYDENKNFANKKTSQLPVKGTIPRGHLGVKFEPRGVLISDKKVINDKIKSAKDDDYDAIFNSQSGLFALSAGDSELKTKDATAAGLLKSPIPFSAVNMKRGKRLYERNCFPCHGMGSRMGEVAKANGMLMGPDLSIGMSKTYPEGRLFYIISMGNRIMPGYASQITQADRWKIVQFVQYSIQNKKR